jgi:flagellar motor switch protein FliG
VAEEIASLGVVAGDKRQKALQFCMKGIIEMGGALRGDPKTANALLIKAIGEKRAAAILQERTASGQQVFSSFKGIDPEEISEVLVNEQPGVIAIVLRYLPVETAGEVLRLLSEEVRQQTILFMATASTPSPEVIARVESFMTSRIKKGKQGQKFKDKDNLEVVAGILQHVGSSIETEVMSTIEEKSPDLANAIRDKLFTFEDIVKLSNTAMRRLLSEIDTSILAVALRGVSINLREKFFSNMSKRAAAALKEEMEFSPKVKISEIDKNQREIVAAIRNLQGSGEITIGEGAEDEYV